MDEKQLPLSNNDLINLRDEMVFFTATSSK